MKYFLPANNLYSNKPIELNIPDDWDVRVCSFAGCNRPKLNYHQLRKKFLNPECEPIVVQAKGCHNAVIIVDDITRPTYAKNIANVIIKELHKVGINDENIHFMFALGMHRGMSRDEMIHKLGKEIVNKYAIYCHNPFFNCINLGYTSNGCPIEVNRDIWEADFKIAIGSCMPHAAVGIAGGNKILLPGVAGVNSIKYFHEHVSSDRWHRESIGKTMIDEFGKAVGLNMKIDVLLNGKGEIVDIFCGKADEIVKKHYEELKAHFKTEYDLNCDVVIANNYFKPSETKLALSGNGLMKNLPNGTTLIVSSFTPAGLALHYMFGRFGEGNNGGLMFKGSSKVKDNIKQYVAFTNAIEKGIGDHWHYTLDRCLWTDNWSEIVELVGSGKHRLVIYPYSSVAYFGEEGNINC